MSTIQRKTFLKKLSLLLGSAGAGLSSLKKWDNDDLRNRFDPSKKEVLYLWGKNSENNGSNPDYRPKIEIYQPDYRDEPTEKRPAILICPGGGYTLQAPHEGQPLARLFAIHGITAAVLTYRVKPDRFPGSFADAARAMRMLRSESDTFHIDPERIGIMGFSAGGHLASTVAVQPQIYKEPEDDLVDGYSARPQRVILGYPVISLMEYAHQGSVNALLGENPDPKMLEQLSNHKQVSADSPPAFLFHTADDSAVPVQNSLMYAEACVNRNVPVDLHVFSHGEHGVGMAQGNPQLEIWTENLMNWLSEWTM